MAHPSSLPCVTSHPRRIVRRVLAATALVVLGLSPNSLTAQVRIRVPADDYEIAFVPYHDGDYRTALNAFRSAARSGVRSTEGQWVDAICYYTMMGECLYHMGELGSALDQYNSALKLMIVHRDWMLRIQFPGAITASGGMARPVTWGAPSRRTSYGQFPDYMLSFQGRLDNDRVIREGGVVAPPTYYSLDATEVARCIAVSLRRRAEIMGVTCPHDPLTHQILQALSARSAPPNHWSQTWLDSQIGLAYVGAGKGAQGVAELQRSLQIGGQFDHPLTAITLLELGKIAFAEGQYAAAATYFLEASYPAAYFGQYDLVAEALHWGLVANLVSGQRGAYPPLLAASNWASRESDALLAELQISLAENQASMGDAASAANTLAQARRVMGRAEMSAGRAGCRLEYITALTQFQAGNLNAGEAALNKVLAFQRTGSRKLFQLALADSYYASGVVTPREADELFAHLLSDPAAVEWLRDPMETLSVVATPHPLPMEHWFEVALQRSDQTKALEIADRIRRHRFHSTLPLGGRLMALRWVLEAPDDLLTEAARLQRQDLLMKYPRYGQLARQSQAVRAELENLPLVAADEETMRRQSGLYQSLAQTSAAQEVIIHEMAVRREPSEFLFPPQRSLSEIQQQLGPGKLVLAFFATSRAVYGFSVTADSLNGWQLKSPRQVRADLATMLRELGNHDGNASVDGEQLGDVAWRSAGRSLWSNVIGAYPLPWNEVEELIIVPDGVIWHVPFEALPMEDGDDAELLMNRARVRYAPTLALAAPDRRPSSPAAQTAVVVGPLIPGQPADAPMAAAMELAQSIPNTFTLDATQPVASPLYGAIADRVVVLQDIETRQAGPYDWAPVPAGRGKMGLSVAGWMTLPWGAPDQLILPAFHTAAESSLKRASTGDEIFLSLCGLMSTGTRTILISRWRTGGQTSVDLAKEFVQELPHTSADVAWQRSVQLTMSGEVDPAREPRIQKLTADGLKADHPFFWAGYLLVDSQGDPNEILDIPASEPAAELPAAMNPARMEAPEGVATGAAETEATDKEDAPQTDDADDSGEAEVDAPDSDTAATEPEGSAIPRQP